MRINSGSWAAAMGIDAYEFYLQLEDDFGIRILDNAGIIPAERVGELFDVVVTALHAQHPERFAADSDFEKKAWEQYADILVNQTGINREQVVRSAHFVDDLKLY